MQKLGKAFSDNIILSKKRRSTITPTQLRGWGIRLTFLYVFLLVSMVVMMTRLFHLTVVAGQENRELSESNRIRTVTIHAPRGIFYDRRGKPLVVNIPAFRVTGPCEKDKACHTKFMTEEEWRVSGISANSVYLEKDFLREYISGYETAHVLGYLGELNEAELTNPYYSYQDYHLGDRIGRTGLEEVWEKKLRGIDGKELIEIDAQHNKIRTLGKIDPIPGTDVMLSIDIDLQKAAYQALGENAGAVIVSKPKTGELLTLVSTPSFNPNQIHKGISQTDFLSLLESGDKPLYNRAISGVYPPGSTFKLVGAVAGLESGSINQQTQIEDTGILRIGQFSFANWYFSQYGKTEGTVDILRAIGRSNDIFFYKLGEATGITKIAEWGKKFGIGTKTGIELSGEAEGYMPDPESRKKIYGSEWYLGDTYHLAIGQGDLVVTPLQVNHWTNAIAGEGILCKPTLEKVSSQQSAVSSCKDLHIKKETLDLITEGMRRACYKGDDVGYQGTGWPFFDFSVLQETLTSEKGTGQKKDVPVACKTGTSEFGDPDGKTHAWFTAFSPVPEKFAHASNISSTITGDPEIVVTVFVEKGGEGSIVAGPIAKKVMEEWFKR